MSTRPANSDARAPRIRRRVRRSLLILAGVALTGLLLALIFADRLLCFCAFTDLSGRELQPRITSAGATTKGISLAGVHGNRIPMLLHMPMVAEKKLPVVILYAGHNSTKEAIIRRFAPRLAVYGIAALAVDLADHGEKSTGTGTFFDDLSAGNVPRIVRGIRESVIDGRRAVTWAQRHPLLDPDRIGVMGTSLGAYIALVHASVDDRLRFAVLNSVGSEHEAAELGGHWLLHFRKAFLPTYHAARISERPVLMLHGRLDRVVPAAGAQTLYEALRGPKRIVWYDAGHTLPPEAIHVAVAWIAGLQAGLAAPSKDR